jgi:tripartite-type tricarboxylate transporter receptor subunit TctC
VLEERGLLPFRQRFDDPIVMVGMNNAESVRALIVNRLTPAYQAANLKPPYPSWPFRGLPGFYRSVWIGLWLPKGASKDLITKLNAAVQAVLAEPNMRTRIAELGQEIFPREQQTPEGLAAHQKAEIEKWWPIIKSANIKGE